MSADDRLLELFERANPVTDPEIIEIGPSADDFLTELVDARDTVEETTIIDPTPAGPTSVRRPWVPAAAAAAAVVLLVVAALVAVSRDESTPADDPADDPTPTSAPPPTTPVTSAPPNEPDPADAAVVDAFFAAHNAGATEAMLAMTAPDVIATVVFANSHPAPESSPIADWDRELAWLHSQGHALTEPTCILAADQPVGGAALSCTYSTLDVFVQAVGDAPIPTRALITIVDGHVTEFHQAQAGTGDPFLFLPFESWMREHHPDVDGVEAGTWTSVDEAIEHGELRARWAGEWARYLDEHGCTPYSPCEPAEAVVDTSAAVPQVERLPTAVSGSTQSTVIGDITWTLVEGDETTLPDRVLYEIGGRIIGTGDDGTGWVSDDGIVWTTTDATPDSELVVAAAANQHIVDVGGERWAVATDRDFRRSELVRWNGDAFSPVELPAPSAPSPEGLEVRSTLLSQPLAVGHDLVVMRSTNYRVQLPDSYARTAPDGTPIDTDLEWVSEIGQFRVVGSFSDRASGPGIDVEVVDGDPERLLLRDAESGDIAASVEAPEGLSATDLILRLRRLRVVHNEVLVGGGDGFTTWSTPWTWDEISHLDVLDDRLLAVVDPTSDDQTAPPRADGQLWSSGESGSWQRRPLPNTTGETADSVSITSSGTSAIVTIISSGPGEQVQAWLTEDTATWFPADGAASYADVSHTDLGWYNLPDDERFPTEFLLGLSLDGLVWQTASLDDAALELGDEGGFGAWVNVVGNRFFVTMSRDDGRRIMWVGVVEAT